MVKSRQKRQNKQYLAREPLLSVLLFLLLMEEVLPPAFSNQEKKITENDNAENSYQEKIVTEEDDVLRFLVQS
jgi:hypothetical protein